MITSEKEMVRKLSERSEAEDCFTSLQPTYEDTVPPDPDEDWTLDQDESRSA